MNIETIIITDRDLIQKLTGKDYNQINLKLDHKYYQIHYEEDLTDFEITWWLPYYYKIKNILKDNQII